MSEFEGAGKAIGLELFRIEKLKPVKMPKVDGNFHEGDSYILLSTTMKGNKPVHNIHFWLGKETSDDEAGCAAYKTVELDNALGGGPVQYREMQGSESPLFLSYFKSNGGIQYVPGGVQSGFRKVEKDKYDPRLLHCKGSRTVRVNEVPLSNKSLNKGDVFILDLGLKIFIFNGPTSNRQEKSKGVEVASRINSDERSGRATIIFLDDDFKNNDFWEPLGGYIDPNSLPDGENDATVKVEKVSPKLLVLLPTKTFNIVGKEGAPLTKDLLKSADVFLVHSTKLYLWIGKSAPVGTKKEATINAVKYIKSKGLPANTAIERVSEGVETNSFKAEFSKWEIVIQKHSGVASMGPDKNIDVSDLLARKKKEDAPIDDGSGKVEVWVVRNFDLSPVEPSKYGQFFGGDSYVILYTYLKNKIENYIIYFWLGDKSTADEKGAAALKAKEKDDALGGKPVQVRVVQGKEPAHFHQLFKGKMVIHTGGHASGFKNLDDKDSYDTDGIALFHVKGTTPLNTIATQVKEVAHSLNSDDCFVLVTPSHVYAWSGKNSSDEEKSTSMNIAQLLSTSYNGTGGRVVESVKEGSEPAPFWKAIGGKTYYAKSSAGTSAPRDPRLFCCSNATGSFNVEEVFDFTQSDLNDEDVFLLDTYTNLYIWIGSKSNEVEKTKSMGFAQKFVADANDGRDPDCPIISIHAGQEPYMFAAQFVGWDDSYTEKLAFKDPYAAKLEQMKSASSPLVPADASRKLSNAATTETVAPASRKLSNAATTETVAPASRKLSNAATTETVAPASRKLSNAATTETVAPASRKLSNAATTETVAPASRKLSNAVTTETVAPEVLNNSNPTDPAIDPSHSSTQADAEPIIDEKKVIETTSNACCSIS